MAVLTQSESRAAPGLARWMRWRTPPNWSSADWRQEARAEEEAAAACAHRDFDPSKGIPLTVFVRKRAQYAVLTRYRREWRYALRTIHEIEPDAIAEPQPGNDPPVYEHLRRALLDLPVTDRRLLCALYCDRLREQAVAVQFGVSQQAISKRKRRILSFLRARLSPPVDPKFSAGDGCKPGICLQ